MAGGKRSKAELGAQPPIGPAGLEAWGKRSWGRSPQLARPALEAP
jgi:hypothetical protein